VREGFWRQHDMRKKLRQASHKAVYEVGSSPEKLKSSVEASLNDQS